MHPATAIPFRILLSDEALWPFALSAHIARLMESVTAIFRVVALVGVWLAYSRGRPFPIRLAAARALAVGLSLMALGAGLSAIAIVSA